jgi:hypothetical protein
MLLAENSDSQQKRICDIFVEHTHRIEKQILQQHLVRADNQIIQSKPFNFSERQFLHEKILEASQRNGISYAEAIDNMMK